MKERLRGLIAAVHSPFQADGSLNLDCVERQAEHLLRHGVIGSFVCGSTGEGASLTVAERQQLAQRWMQVAGDRIRVIVHVGHNCLANSVELAAHAQSIGAHGISVVAPNYFRPATVRDLIGWCKHIAAAAPTTPFFYYHIPGITGVDLPVYEFLSQAAEHIPTLEGVKFTSEDLMDFGDCAMLDEGRWQMIYGRDQMLLPALALGAQSAIGTTFNYTAPLFHEVIGAWGQQDLDAARTAQHRCRQVIRALHPSNVIPSSKAVMQILGIDCGPVRPPLSPITEDELRRLRGLVQEFHLER